MSSRSEILTGLLVATSLAACAPVQVKEETLKPQPVANAAADDANPLLLEWTGPWGLPPFARIRVEHFLPAVKAGVDAQRREVAAIVDQSDQPTFENTILALDRSGRLLEKVETVLYNLSSAETTPELQAVMRDVAPLTTALEDDIFLDRRLFARVDAIWKAREDLGLDPVAIRLISEMRKAFVRSGASLDDATQARLREINQELAVLGLKFGDNLLAETNAFQLVLDNPGDLAGLAPATIEAAAAAAEKAGMPGKWLVNLSYPSMWPFVQQSARRDLRRQVITAYAERCNRGNEYDNRETVVRIATLRLEKARLLGYPSWADFVLEERMAKTPDGVDGLLDRLWEPALGVARREAAEYAAAAAADGIEDGLEAWDWHYYAEKIRASRYGIDSDKLREYFALDNVLSGAFELARLLYGITFIPVQGLELYSPDVMAWEVRDADGSFLGLFLGDYHPRPGKRVGAWSSRYRSQEIVDGVDIRPIVVNVGNFTRPSGASPPCFRPTKSKPSSTNWVTASTP